MNNVVQRGAHAERNCLALLKKCYCDAAVVRGISERRGCDWLKWPCCLGDGRGGYGSVAVRRDLRAAWMEEAAADLLTQRERKATA